MRNIFMGKSVEPLFGGSNGPAPTSGLRGARLDALLPRSFSAVRRGSQSRDVFLATVEAPRSAPSSRHRSRRPSRALRADNESRASHPYWSEVQLHDRAW